MNQDVRSDSGPLGGGAALIALWLGLAAAVIPGVFETGLFALDVDSPLENTVSVVGLRLSYYHLIVLPGLVVALVALAAATTDSMAPFHDLDRLLGGLCLVFAAQWGILLAGTFFQFSTIVEGEELLSVAVAVTVGLLWPMAWVALAVAFFHHARIVRPMLVVLVIFRAVQLIVSVSSLSDGALQSAKGSSPVFDVLKTALWLGFFGGVTVHVSRRTPASYSDA